MRNISVKLFLIGACSVEPNHLCNFERGHHREHSCEFIEIWTSGSGGDFV